MQELERQFKADGGSFKEYKIGKLFEKQTLRFKKRKFNKVNDVSKDKTADFTIPLVNAKNGDNGIMYYGRESDFETAEMCIDIVNDGAVSTGNVYPQPQKTGVLYNAYLVKPIFNANEELLIYCAQALQKSIKFKFGYDKKASWERVQEEFVSLPTLNGEISFAYMENVICELQNECRNKLNDYLKEIGLDNTELSQEEKDAVQKLREGNVVWTEKQIGELFEKIKVNSLKYKAKDLPSVATDEYDLPALTAGIQNQGLNSYVPRNNATILKNVISISANGANTGATFYQSKEFTVLQDAYAIKWIYSDDNLTDNQYLYFVVAISKTIYGNYEWTNKAGWERIKNNKISLPVTPDGEIDWDFMQNLISAESRLAIRGVVGDNDKGITMA